MVMQRNRDTKQSLACPKTQFLWHAIQSPSLKTANLQEILQPLSGKGISIKLPAFQFQPSKTRETPDTHLHWVCWQQAFLREEFLRLHHSHGILFETPHPSQHPWQPIPITTSLSPAGRIACLEVPRFTWGWSTLMGQSFSIWSFFSDAEQLELHNWTLTCQQNLASDLWTDFEW